MPRHSQGPSALDTLPEDCEEPRDINWAHATNKEKIKRMRFIVKQEMKKTERLTERLRLLELHLHASNGNIVMPMEEINKKIRYDELVGNDDISMIDREARDEVFF